MNEQTPLPRAVATRVLEIGCEPGSIHYMVLPGMGRNAVRREPEILNSPSGESAAEWWRPVGVA